MRRRTSALAGLAVLVAATATGGVVGMSSLEQQTPAAPGLPANTATVERGALSAMVSMDGTLTYRAQSNGSPYALINQARGTYTRVPDDGDEVACGDVLYRVDNNPVLLLCGATPAFRPLLVGDRGPDVMELNANLVQLGYATNVQLDPSSDYFGPATAFTLAKLQSTQGEEQTGALDFGQAIFLPESVRVAQVTAEPGGAAQPGAQVMSATSDTPEVQVALDPSLQAEVQPGNLAEVGLPGGRSVAGKVDRLGRVAQVPAGQNTNAGDATIPAYISLDDPQKAAGFDRAPVQVEITTGGVEDALSVPVTAIVGKAGGGFAVEVVRTGNRRALVAVELGLFDTAGGRVQVKGDLREGDRVVVPSS